MFNTENRRPIRNGLAGKVLLCLSLAAIGGCSATTLRCGTNGESSYVELINLPQDIAGTTRHYKNLCAFNYEGANDAT